MCVRAFQVGSCDVRFPIRLEGLASTHSIFSSVSSRAADSSAARGANVCTQYQRWGVQAEARTCLGIPT